MLDVLPALFWIIAVAWMIVICVLCVIRGKLLQPGHPPVDQVSWGVIGAQFASVVLAAVPFVIGKVCIGSFGSAARGFYLKAAWPAGMVLILLIAAELVLMFLQARRSTYTELGAAIHPNGR